MLNSAMQISTSSVQPANVRSRSAIGGAVSSKNSVMDKILNMLKGSPCDNIIDDAVRLRCCICVVSFSRAVTWF